MATKEAYDVWAVVKDPGGTNGVLPVVDVLRAPVSRGGMGLKVLTVANGKAVELLKGKEGVEAYDSPDRILAAHDLPKMLVTSMCSKGGVGRDLVPLLRNRGIPTIALQDFWGVRLQNDWADAKFWPDAICVNDEVGAKIVRSAWADYDSRRIKVTGYPAQDKLASLDIERVATNVRDTLGIGDDKSVVVYGGHYNDGKIKKSGETLCEIVEALNAISRSVYFIPRAHPRMKDNAPEELPKWEYALKRFNAGVLITDTSYKDMTPLLALVSANRGVIASVFSTVLVDAAALGCGNNISILYPEAGMACFDEEMGGSLKEFPLVDLGCTAKATNRKELIELLRRAFSGGLGFESKQAATFKLDGQNAARAAKEAVTLIKW